MKTDIFWTDGSGLGSVCQYIEPSPSHQMEQTADENEAAVGEPRTCLSLKLTAEYKIN